MYLCVKESVHLHDGHLSVYDVDTVLQIVDVFYYPAIEIVYRIVRHISVYVENTAYDVAVYVTSCAGMVSYFSPSHPMNLSPFVGMYSYAGMLSPYATSSVCTSSSPT